ncbi:MAG TPA: ATP-binding protein [Polyangiaceae bacterium]|nr:ATP-binding protein [Polyangiaceae bacterium]
MSSSDLPNHGDGSGSSVPAGSQVAGEVAASAEGGALATVVGAETGASARERRAADDLARALARAEAAERRSAFLAQITGLFSESLDLATTLGRAARLTTPDFADLCLVYLHDGRGGLQIVATASSSPGQEGALRALALRPLRVDDDVAPARVARTGVAEWSTGDDGPDGAAPGDDGPDGAAPGGGSAGAGGAPAEGGGAAGGDRGELWPLEARSFIVAPLSASGRVLGAMTFARGSEARGYEPADVPLAEELARRAAFAIANAELYRESQKALRSKQESIALLDTLLATAPIGLAFVDPGLRLARANGAFAELSGVPLDRALGREVGAGLPALGPALEPLYREVLASGEARLERSLRHEGPGGVRHWRASVYPVRSAAGDLLLLGTIVVDVTSQIEAAEERDRLLGRAEEARRQAEAANRLKDEFLATVSHELRTPLSAILGWATILQRDRAADPETLQKGLAVIERNARSQEHIVEDILDVGRIVRGQLRIEPEPIDLASVAAEVLDAVRPTAAARGVELCWDDGGGPCRLLGDPERLRQILWNLLSNAVKFTPPGGRVALEMGLSEGKMVVRVRDTGRGIEPDFLPYVFERFRQADGSTTRTHGGLGLGLAIVRHLVEMHGGVVSAESEGPGRGATFTVTLPVRPFTRPVSMAPPEPPRPGERAPAPGGLRHRLRGLRVLVAEDQDDARELIELVLSNEGAQVRGASSADEALELLPSFAPGVLVSDVGMPGHDGYWLAERVRARFPALPAVALTAFVGKADVERAHAAGFSSHLGKPVDAERLIELIVELAARDGAEAP